MGSHDPFGHLKHKLSQNKGSKSNWQFDFRPLKVENCLNFLMCKQHATYHWKKILIRATTFLQTSSQLEVYTQNYKAPKSRESQLWEFQDSHLGIPKQNAIWMWASWRGTKYTIGGKVVASPSSNCGEFYESEFARGSSQHQKCFNYALTNLLFGLCIFV